PGPRLANRKPVGFNGYMDAPGPILINECATVRSEIGGVERWALEMANRLPRIDPGRYRVAAPPPALAFRAGHVWEQAVLPARAARARAALVYCPANLSPLAWPRCVLSLHDVAVLVHPEFYSRPYVAWQRALLPRIARRARLLHTVSEFSRGEIVQHLGVDPAGVAVVPGGVDDRFTPAADAGAAAGALGLALPYVLTVATPSGRKNLAALAAPARALAAEGVELVVAGGGRDYLRGAAAGGGVRAVGYVEEALLPGLYAGARAFVLPSRHEGFGLPCVEAMASGGPVVAADRGGLPEACGDAALLVDPDDPEALTAAVLRATGDEAARVELRAAGLARAAELTWDRTAGAIHEILTRAA
ncbi:MAG: glycosyltransferase family 4 protein, partial [Solirubrobacteraceae bacterium]